jgi:transcriptional regulator with XRE-family HTH domain
MRETLGELITRRMRDLGIASKSELARLTGYSNAYIGDLINNTGKTKSGTYQPSPELVSKLAGVLKITEIEILATIGYSSDGALVLPEEIKVMDFDGFDKEDLKDIAEFIKFKRMQKGLNIEPKK